MFWFGLMTCDPGTWPSIRWTLRSRSMVHVGTVPPVACIALRVTFQRRSKAPWIRSRLVSRAIWRSMSETAPAGMLCPAGIWLIRLLTVSLRPSKASHASVTISSNIISMW